ncbi:MAG: MogA/MoaB family molybdenum cofactor biosynthesis protein [Thermomicrobiales bacterium]
MSDLPFSVESHQHTNSASTEQHREQAPESVAVAVLTISDTRTTDDDRSGQIIKQQLTWRGHDLRDYAIVKDDATEIETILQTWIGRDDIRAIVTNGGTGISRRDTTYEVVARMLEKELTGFGELFRMLSYPEIGAAAMLSRAIAGVASRTAIFCLPGSSNAVKLGMEKLIAPELAHVVFEMTK